MKLIKTMAMTLCIAFASAAGAEEIRVEGGGAATHGVFFPVMESFQEETGDKLNIQASTPVQGLKSLLKDEVDIATAAYPFEELMRMAEKAGLEVDPKLLWSKVIGKNQVLAFVHRSNAIPALSKEQLKRIFTGKITNWKEVGGADLPIEVVWGKKTPGQNALFSSHILDGEEVTPKAIEALDYSSIRSIVESRPGAIGIDPKGYKTGLTRNPKIPEVFSPFIAVTKGAPSPKVERLLKFIASVENR